MKYFFSLYQVDEINSNNNNNNNRRPNGAQPSRATSNNIQNRSQVSNHQTRHPYNTTNRSQLPVPINLPQHPVPQRPQQPAPQRPQQPVPQRPQQPAPQRPQQPAPQRPQQPVPQRLQQSVPQRPQQPAPQRPQQPAPQRPQQPAPQRPQQPAPQRPQQPAPQRPIPTIVIQNGNHIATPRPGARVLIPVGNRLPFERGVLLMETEFELFILRPTTLFISLAVRVLR